MSLNELLKKITPLPWICVKNDTVAHHIHNRQGKDVVLGFMNYEDATYTCHVAQVLPELVRTAKLVQSNYCAIRCGYQDHTQECRDMSAALARAEKVEADNG